MKNLSLVLLFLIVSLTAAAQSVGKRMLTHTTPDGTLYFVADKSLSNRSKDVKEFVFDVTYLENKDSLVVNFTIVSNNSQDVKTLCLTDGSVRANADEISTLYHQFKGKKYEVRTTSRLSYDDFHKVFTSLNPAEFQIIRTDGTACTATYSASQWKKEREFFEKVFYVINKK